MLVIYVTLVYAPIAAWLVELFPSRIRYSGMSLPYHIGNGWFGGFLPATVFAIVAATGNIYSGLWYPVGVAIMSLIIGFLFLPETKDVDITADPEAHSGQPPARTTIVEAGRGVLRGRFAFQVTPDELQHDLAAMRARAMLDQIDRLPGSEREFALQDRNLQRGRRQHGFDMRGHVVGTFGVMAPSGIFGRQPIERRPADRRAPSDRHSPGSSATPRYGE